MSKLTRAALIGLVAAGLASAASAADRAEPARQCFHQSQWDGWSAPDNSTLYVKTRTSDVYRVELTRDVRQLTSPGAQVVSVGGRDNVCHPLDLDLRVSDFGSIVPLRAKAITRMTPDEVAAIPSKKRPLSQPDIR